MGIAVEPRVDFVEAQESFQSQVIRDNGNNLPYSFMKKDKLCEDYYDHNLNCVVARTEHDINGNVRFLVATNIVFAAHCML